MSSSHNNLASKMNNIEPSALHKMKNKIILENDIILKKQSDEFSDMIFRENSLALRD
jgi:hypothetical protein